ncbi:MAG: response regulator [Ruminococcus sp.]|nr:response regulator [Ruminococcus sp.]
MEIEKAMLESCGLDVITAESGGEAVRMAENEEFFMILMDIHMPVMDGYETAKIIRKTNKSVPIIALTADSISDVESRFRECGIDGYLQKPLQTDELHRILQNYINVSVSGGKKENDSYFDCDSLSAVLNDDKAVMRVLNQFISAHGNDCETLRNAVISEDFITAREILHNIIGISGNLFCHKLYTVSCRFSLELKQECSDSFDAFEEVWDKTLTKIDLFMEKLPLMSEKTAEKSFDEIWEQFFSLCYYFDISAVDIFTENINLFRENINKTDFENLKEAVMKYDFLWISENMEEYNV